MHIFRHNSASRPWFADAAVRRIIKQKGDLWMKILNTQWREYSVSFVSDERLLWATL
jgi:hypothetical protein